MFLIPYKMETIFTRFPFSNAILIVVTSLMFFFTAFGFVEESSAESLVLQDWDVRQMIGSAFLHGGLFHLVGNMLFLWIFGNAICATVGNLTYPFLYLVLALFASAAHLMFDGNPAIGASGAVNGIVGMALVVYPLNKLHCAYAFSMPMMGIFWKSGKFTTKSFWMILLWLAFDILGVVTGGGNTAYWAHLGGFTFGMGIALLFLLFEAIETYDPTLIDVVTGRKLKRETYDLQELAEKTPGPVRYMTPEESKPDPGGLMALPETGKESNPLLQVTSLIKKQDVLICLFFNDGDAVKEVRVESEEPVVAEIHPSIRLDRRASGSLKLKNAPYSDLNSAKLWISYSRGNQRVRKPLLYDQTARKLSVGDSDIF